jgi:large subunit ribosomal protein L19
MKNRLLALVEEHQLQNSKTIKITEKDKEGTKTETVKDREIGKFQEGDQVDVHVRILEGEKERTQVFTGTVIARRGAGTREMFTVRRIVQGEGVERVFPVCSPKIAKIEVKRTGRVRRAKLYYLRKRVGKATRLRERSSRSSAREPVVPGTSAETPTT